MLSTTLLVAVGRAAARHALDARLRQDELQRRWATASCRQAVLPYAESILSTIEQRDRRPAPEYRVTIQLGNDSLLLVVADEQAKANVNAILDRSGVQGAEDRVRESVSGSGLLNRVRLRPGPVDPGRSLLVPERIHGPGQLFDSVDPDRLLNARLGLTWWGGGNLNLMRADPAAMRAALMPTLTRLEIDRLVAARDQVAALSVTGKLTHGMTPAAGDAINNLLSMAKIDPGVRNGLPVTARSDCHSLWIILDDGRRTWTSAIGSDQAPGRPPKIESLAW